MSMYIIACIRSLLSKPHMYESINFTEDSKNVL